MFSPFLRSRTSLLVWSSNSSVLLLCIIVHPSSLHLNSSCVSMSFRYYSSWTYNLPVIYLFIFLIPCLHFFLPHHLIFFCSFLPHSLCPSSFLWYTSYCGRATYLTTTLSLPPCLPPLIARINSTFAATSSSSSATLPAVTRPWPVFTFGALDGRTGSSSGRDDVRVMGGRWRMGTVAHNTYGPDNQSREGTQAHTPITLFLSPSRIL